MKQIAAVELERCVALADLLETVPPEDFNLRSWVSQLPMETRNWLGFKRSCGFAGCAMGWAAHAGIFPGFELEGGGLIYRQFRETPTKNWDAVMRLMGIKLRTAEYLFYTDAYKTNPTPAMVADRLRRFANKIAAIRARDRRKVTAPVQRKLELVA